MTVVDVIVLGCGGVGSSVLYHLARRGVSVLGLDRFPIAHDRGSTHGETRLIRQAYFEHPDYVPLMRRAYELWADLEAISGQKLYFESGVLQVGLKDGRVIPGVLASARLHGLTVEELTPADLAHRFPGFRVPEPLVAVFEPQSGYLRVEDCVRAAATAAQAAGAQIRIGETVRGWKSVPGGVEVVTEAGTYHAKSLVITAGSWADDFLGDLGITLEVVRKSLYWYESDTPQYREDHGGPGFIFETLTGNFYGFPQICDQGVKVAEHSGGLPVASPLEVDRTEDAVETARVQSFLQECLPGVSRRQTRFATCLYTLSPDRNFIVDRHPDAPHVCFAAGLSGHGFKFASVLGEILADWATTGTTAQPVGFLNCQRAALFPAS